MRRVPVATEIDIVVVGGGPGGFAAAGLGAGGIHTELMERFDEDSYIHTATQSVNYGFSSKLCLRDGSWQMR